MLRYYTRRRNASWTLHGLALIWLCHSPAGRWDYKGTQIHQSSWYIVKISRKSHSHRVRCHGFTPSGGGNHCGCGFSRVAGSFSGTQCCNRYGCYVGPPDFYPRSCGTPSSPRGFNMYASSVLHPQTRRDRLDL